MITTPTQALELNKASIDVLSALAASAFQATEKLAQLNLAASRTMLQDSSAAAQSLLAVKDVQGAVDVARSWAAPNAEKFAGYTRTAMEIAAAAGSNVSGILDTQVEEGKRKVTELLELAAKSAPAGSEPVLALFRSAVSTANSTFDTLAAAARQGTEYARTNAEAAVNAAGEAARKVA
jgi:phasin family protein